MTLVEIQEQVDNISETWRTETVEEQRAELVRLDGALADLDGTDPDSSTEAFQELRGRIEVLMDEIEIKLGVELEPIDVPEELEVESERGIE